MFSHKALAITLTELIRFSDFSQMADDEVAIMEEGGMEEDETPAEEEEVAGSEEASEEAPPAEGDEDLPAEEDDAEAGEAGGGEDGEEEVLAEDAVGDDDLGIRDEDQGRPVTALRLLSCPDLVTLLNKKQKQNDLPCHILLAVKSRSRLRSHQQARLKRPTRAC